MGLTNPTKAHHVKKGSCAMLKGHPCKVVEVKISKTGKHGHAKCNITGVDVLYGRKYNEVYPGHIIMSKFEPKKTEYDVSLIDVEDETVTCMDEDGKEFQFNLKPDKFPLHSELMKEYQENEEEGGDKYWVINVTSAPVGDKPGEEEAVEEILEYKLGKD